MQQVRKLRCQTSYVTLRGLRKQPSRKATSFRHLLLALQWASEDQAFSLDMTQIRGEFHKDQNGCQNQDL